MQYVEDGGHFGLEAASDGRRVLRRRGGGRDGSHGGARAARIGERRQEERRDGAVAAQVRGPGRPAPAAIGAGANLLRSGGRGRGGDREPVRERGGLEVAHERSKTRAEEIDGRRVRELLPTGAAAQVPVDQVLIAPQRSVRHELHRVREQRRELLNVACERVRRDLNSRADPADQIERR